MKVSIIIPAYNVEGFITETIESVISQTYKNWEVIIVNDGSTDHTESKIIPYLDKNIDISYYSIKNSGVANARNYGIDRANGEYIAFLDSDDTFEPNNLELKVKTLSENTNIDWVYSDYFEGDINMTKTGVGPLGTDKNIFENILLWERDVVPGPSSNIVARRKCFEEGIRFDPKFSTAADQDFCLSISKEYKAKRIPEPLWTYRILETSMSRNIALMEKDHLGVYQKAKELNYFESKTFEKKCFSNLYFIIGASWLKNSNKKLRGIFFLLKSMFIYPKQLKRLLK